MISIIISVYNNEQTIDKCIEAILKQTFQDFELIIIDDNSSDSSWHQIEAYRKIDKRINVYRNSVNLGLAKSLNRAICLSQYKLIARMDGDDYPNEKWLESLYCFLSKNKNIDIVGSFATLINSKGEIIGNSVKPTEHNEIIKALRYSNPIIHPSVVIRREVFKKLSGYNSKLTKAQDLDLWHRASRRGFIFANYPSELINYRIELNKPFLTIFKGFTVSFSYALRNKSFIGVAASIIDLSKYMLIKFNLYKPRNLRKVK